MCFEEIAEMMAKECNSDVRQLQVQVNLDTLRLDIHMSDHDLPSPSASLSEKIDLIECLTTQYRPQFRSDANKINNIEAFLDIKVLIKVLTDSKVDISNGSETSEKRTMLDISATREAFRERFTL